MLSYDSLLNRRRLEDFLNSETKVGMEEELVKEHFIWKVVNYFTINSKIGYIYKMNKAGDDVEYHLPRSFSGDIRNIRNYLTNLFSKKK